MQVTTISLIGSFSQAPCTELAELGACVVYLWPVLADTLYLQE